MATPGLGKLAARGAAVTLVAQVSKVVLTFVTTIFTARLLSPEDFGVIAMTAPVTGLLLLFQNMGLGDAVLQSRKLESEQLNAMFWLNMAATLVIILLMLLCSPAVAWFYDDVRPSYVLVASCITVLVIGLQRQHAAMLNREMRYGAVGASEMALGVVTCIATIGFAVVLRDYWAVWAGTLCGVIAGTAILWRATPWRPRLGVSLKGTRSLVTVGANMTAFNFVNFLARNTDNVLIARAWGAGPLGLYDRSYRLMVLPLQSFLWPLTRVVIPSLTRLREDDERYREGFLFTVGGLCLVLIPGIIAGAICSHGLVPLLLGAQWSGASPIFFWLSLAGVTQPVISAMGWLFITSERSGAMAKWGVFTGVVVVASFVIGLPDGPIGVARAYFIGQLLLLVPLLAFATRQTPVSPGDIYASMAPTLGGGLITWAIIGSTREALPFWGELGLALVLSYSTSALLLGVTGRGRRQFGRSLELARSLIPRRS